MEEKYYKLNFIYKIMKRGGIKLKKRGQVWIETVIYILIAFVMIGLVLSFIRPKIEEIRDKTIIEQSLEMINNLDSLISEIKEVSGNKRLVDLNVKKGSFILDGEGDKIQFEIYSRYIYTEEGANVTIGNVVAHTEDKGEYNYVLLTRDFSPDYNLTYKKEDVSKILNKATTHYKLYITNDGIIANKTNINFDLK